MNSCLMDKLSKICMKNLVEHWRVYGSSNKKTFGSLCPRVTACDTSVLTVRAPCCFIDSVA